MNRATRTWIALAAAGVVAASAGAAPQVKAVKALHRAGQTFITFDEIGPPPPERLTWGAARRLLDESTVRYRLYAHTERITAANLGAAAMLAEAGPLSGWNLKGRNVEYLIAQAMIQPDAVGELTRNYNGFIRTWHMDHPRMDRYPLERFVIDEQAGPLAPGRGLFVVNPPAAAKRYYAVLACPDGEAGAADVSAANSLAQPVAETVGAGEPVRQGPGLKGPNFDYPGERTVYVQWCNPPLAPASMYFNWSVLIPPDCAERAPVELYFPSGNYSHAKPSRKLMAGSVQIATQDWPPSGWYGYNDRFGTGQDLAGGTVRDHTRRRIAAFLDWAQEKLPIDPDRVVAVGGDGAAQFALGYPKRIAYVMILGFEKAGNVLDPKAARRFEAAWGPKGPQTTDEQGRGDWAWADLDRLVLSAPEADLPLFVCRGASWGGDKGWGKGRGRFYTAMKQAGQPLFAHWAWGGTLFPPDRYTGLWQGLDLRRDSPVPAFANSSADAEGEGSGQTNSVYRWKDVSDTPGAFEITVTGKAGTFDLTPRRLAKFRARPGEALRWEGTYLPGPRGGGADPVSGAVTADEHGLLTLKQLKLPGEAGGIRVRITRAPGGQEVQP